MYSINSQKPHAHSAPTNSNMGLVGTERLRGEALWMVYKHARTAGSSEVSTVRKGFAVVGPLLSPTNSLILLTRLEALTTTRNSGLPAFHLRSKVKTPVNQVIRSYTE